ncbi:ABC transporter ATP-binding protein [Brachybacterium saurashtrense]|uniref:ABC transporter ATP-binding protein n=1 Tax=Brachybacterium saurashtrense TaxID=556288 RepID=A0A345YK09_9MICO|nr:ABC transporter ATP-binding protein [Brachybacterium saurashtrense]AXK44261.1 ABC transporter ATP-binding protein [Brachybacterium saurashtrense]RRR21533.1 ABC transporter ATP-binding protein [Brachybacterium saurashtrense]
MSSLLRILRFTRDLSPLYTAIIICSVLTAAAGLAVPFLIGHATDTVAAAVGGETPTGTAVRTVVLIAAAVLAAELASTVISNVGGWFGDVMSNRMRTILSVRYYDKLLHLPQRWFDGEITGTIVARLNRSITEITNFVKMMSNSFASMLLTTAAVLVISAWYAWPLALLLLVVFPVYVWLTSLTSVKWQRLEGEKNQQVDIASGRFAEVVGQIRVVKSFVRERGELAEFSRRFGSTDATTREQSSHWHRMDVLRRAFLNLVFFGIYTIIFVRTVQGAFSLGEMVLLVQLMSMAKAPVESMSFVIDTAQRAIAGSRDYFRVMETEVDPRIAAVLAARDDEADGAAAAPAVDPVPGAPVVAFRDVSFAYEDGEDVLHGIDFTIDRGEKVALVGESGGGKSTIVNLLLGLYEPRSGSVEVVGRPSDELPLDQLRDRIGVVFQDASLFSGTIRENIAYGRPAASEEEVADAARRANADAFVRRFPDGYAQVIGERGLKLSGGQRQRIAVARAILKDAPVLVLDEATSALDTKSEIQVQKGLDELMTGRTSLIIAHRLSTIAEVDRIITLRDGRIDEIGSPAELAASGGIYAQLLALQSSGDSRRLASFDITG